MRATNRFRQFALTALILGALNVAGCGGGGAGSPGQPAGSAPSQKTLGDVDSVLAGYRQTITCNSLKGYGPRLTTHGGTVFDSILGLWYTIKIAPDGTFETMYQDQARTEPAGTMTYLVDDAALTLGGTFSISSGAYSGLTGSYLQSLQSPGSNGSIEFTIPDVATVDCQFQIRQNNSGQTYGSATNGVALQSGYLQTELVDNLADGSMTTSTTDSNSCKSEFSFSPTLTGAGKISGSDPGLPASITWSSVGAGTIKYADGSTAEISGWQLAGGSQITKPVATTGR